MDDPVMDTIAYSLEGITRSHQYYCRGCKYLEFNEMSDEMYCKLKDYEQIRLRWRKHRPDWCPLVCRWKKIKDSKGGKA